MASRVREASVDDCQSIMDMIHELAAYEKLPEQVAIDKDTLIQDGFKEDPPFFHAIIVEMNDSVAGYALYFHAYDSYAGRHLYLEDLYVKSEFRGHGLGKKLLTYVANVAKTEGLPWIGWCVLNWNEKALEFYDSLGGYDKTKAYGTHMYRLDQQAIDNLLQSSE